MLVPDTSLSNLGIIFDNTLSLEQHVTTVCKAAKYHLRNFGIIRKYLTHDAAERAVHALITSRLPIRERSSFRFPIRERIHSDQLQASDWIVQGHVLFHRVRGQFLVPLNFCGTICQQMCEVLTLSNAIYPN